MEKIAQSGCRALCKVWILDDKHFPTGYANGLLQKKYPERERRFLREHHMDLMGPAKETAILIPPCAADRILRYRPV